MAGLFDYKFQLQKIDQHQAPFNNLTKLSIGKYLEHL